VLPAVFVGTVCHGTFFLQPDAPVDVVSPISLAMVLLAKETWNVFGVRHAVPQLLVVNPVNVEVVTARAGLSVNAGQLLQAKFVALGQVSEWLASVRKVLTAQPRQVMLSRH